jgi:hypothetical protein
MTRGTPRVAGAIHLFDEFIREIRKLEQTVQVPIDMPLDEKGYFDRTCPNSECGAEFKVLFEDWRDKVPDEQAACPKCGERAEPTSFNTSWQQDYIQEFARSYMAGRLNDAMRRASRRTRPKTISAGLFDMKMEVSFKAGHVPVVLPPAAADALRQDLTCDQCGCRFSTIGAGYFCPACGENSPLKDFDQTIEMARKTVAGIDALTLAFQTLHEADSAANFQQQLLEDQVENLITAFQRSADDLFQRLPNSSAFKRDANLFQRLADGSALWKSASGKDYSDVLDSSELQQLQLMIQRRHKIGHCQGMVDDKYVQQSGDTSYAVGMRIVTGPNHVTSLANILNKLVTGLKAIVVSAGGRV